MSATLQMTAGIAWTPTAEIIAGANITRFMTHADCTTYAELEQRASEAPDWFWERLLTFLEVRFYKPFEHVVDMSGGLPFPRWCPGATTNLVLNTLDCRSGSERDRVAVIGASEDGTTRSWTYAELQAEVERIASGLAALGLKRDDIVGIYMPMIPETAAAFLALAKLGCVAMPLFSGFGAAAIATRLIDSQAVAVITVDGTQRKGRFLTMKTVLDEALASVPTVRAVMVVRNGAGTVAMTEGRDHWWHDLQGPPVATAELDAEQPLLLLYTSGTTGRPKGTVHTHCGIIAKCGQDSRFHWDLKAEDSVLWIADMGWSAGPRLIASCLLAGAAVTLVEGATDYPDHDRLWRLIEQHGITIFGLSPSLARSLRARCDQSIDRYDLSSLRVMISSAEPWDRDSWIWTHEKVGRGRVPIMNVSGGTEMGSILATRIIHPLKPGAFHGPVLGTGADIVDEHGRSMPRGELGELVMRSACIGTTRGLWKDPERFLDSYWRIIPDMWVQGDWASRDADGFWFLHGRSDDTIKVSGKRVGPAEIEEVLIGAVEVADAAVVGVPDAVTGSAVVCVVMPMPGISADRALADRLARDIAGRLGTSFRPKRILFVSDLPRTRNMKVMRRVVRSALTGVDAGDLTALLNPEAVAELRALA